MKTHETKEGCAEHKPVNGYQKPEECRTHKHKNCGYNNYKRTRYFHGMLLTDRDFREEQIYLNEKRRLHNRMLHGWGVVCGLKLNQTPQPGCRIVIEPGLALDCAGNEICVCESYELDVIKIIQSCIPKKRTREEECEDMENDAINKWYVVIKYQEVSTDPLPVYAPGGGCEERVCEYSRIREGYCFEVIPGKDLAIPCPEVLPSQKSRKEMDRKDHKKVLCEDALMPCPCSCCATCSCCPPCSCCSSCCCGSCSFETGVVLGSITFQDESVERVIEADMINNWDCRRYVITFPLLQYWMNLLAQYGKKLPFNWIVNYADLGRMCSPEETGMNVQQFMRDMSTLEELTAPEHEPEKLKEEVLEYIRQNPEGVTAKTVSDAMKIKVAVSKSILEDLRNAKKIKLDQAKYFPV